MNKQFDFKKRNSRTKQLDTVGRMEFKNAADSGRAELCFYGDIVSNSWQSYWYDEDKCPQDIVNFLADLDGYSGVDIYINSGGGSVHGGLAIYNILKRYQGEKVVHVDGLAASIASVIAMAGDRIIIPSTAQLMIHKPWCWVEGDADDLRKEADALDSCQAAILAAYMENVKEGITEQQIADMVNQETWLTGDRAAEYFNIEVEQSAEAVACASDYLTKYQHTPENLLSKPEPPKALDSINTKDKLQIELDLLSL